MTLYLAPEKSSVDWMLDPDAPGLADIARAARYATSEEVVDPADVIADLEQLGRLIRERHIGVVTGIVPEPQRVQAVIDSAIERIRRDQPTTRGEALGDVVERLQQILRDQHFAIPGRKPSTWRSEEPKFAPPSDEPAVSESMVDGVLCLRIARLMGGAQDSAALEQFQADARRHLAHDKIIVDLRGCPGGNDGYLIYWALAGTGPDVRMDGSARRWTVDGKVLNAWNQTVLIEACDGPDAVPPFYREQAVRPTLDSRLGVVEEGSDDEPIGTAEQWRGQLLILTDRGCGSSGESSAWALKHLLGGRIVGARSYGVIEYGNVNAYLLENTPLYVQLATQHQDFGVDVEMVGFPVDVAADVTLPLEYFAENFAEFAGTTSTLVSS